MANTPLVRELSVERFEFSGNYYFEILEDLKRFKRNNIKEATAEDDEDIFNQFLKGLAWNIHLDRCLIDMVANERFVTTLALPKSLAAHLMMIGEQLDTASPAKTEQIVRVSLRTDQSNTVLVRPLREFATEVGGDDDDIQSIEFEALDGFIMTQRNDRVGFALAEESAVFTDVTAAAQSGAGDITPWATPAAGDKLYIGHKDLMFDRLDLTIGTVGLDTTQIVHGVWEYHTGYKGGSGTPDLVETEIENPDVLGGTIRVSLESLLGDRNRKDTPVRILCALTGAYEDVLSKRKSGTPTSMQASAFDLGLDFNLTAVVGATNVSGTTIRVTCSLTGEAAELTVQWLSGTNRILTDNLDDPWLGQTNLAGSSLTAADYWIDAGVNYAETTVSGGGTLGQSEVSTVPGHYVVYPLWREISEGQELERQDSLGVTSLSVGTVETIEFELPQTEKLQWRPLDLVDDVSGYFIRYRIVAICSGGTPPKLNKIQISEGGMYGLFDVTQGRTHTEIVGSSSGTENQDFSLQSFPVIHSSIQIFATETIGVEREYVRVKHLFNSTPEDRHFVASITDLGQAVAGFGNGVNGKIPPPGTDNVRAVYRTMDDVDGNVAAKTITDSGGLSTIDKTWNPRAATGWVEREGASLESVERAKGKFHTKLFSPDDRYLQPGDALAAVLRYRAADGTAVASRAWARELGQKLVELIVMPPGGGVLTQDTIDDVEEWFNGDGDKVYGRYVGNQEVRITPATLRPINLTVSYFGPGTRAEVRALLIAALHPEAVNDVTDEEEAYLWAFGEEVPATKLADIALGTTRRGRKILFRGTGTGTIAFTNGSATVTGTGTAFTTQMNAGDRIYRGAYFWDVGEIIDDDTLTLTSPSTVTLSTGAFEFEMINVPLDITELPKAGTINVTVTA